MKRRALGNLERDIEQHIQEETQDNIDRGMTPAEARRTALLKFGNRTLIKEDTRAVWQPRWLEQSWQDLRYGWRMLRRTPSFTAVAVLTLGLGIGLNTAVFSVIRAALLRPLPYPDAGRLVWLSDQGKSAAEDFPVRQNVFEKWRRNAKSFEKVGAFADLTGTLSLPGGSEEEQLTAVGGDLWNITGAQPLYGRLFSPQETDALVLSYALFQRAFGGDPHIVGSLVNLDGHTVNVTGVLRKDFRLLPAAGGTRPVLRQVYVPMRHLQTQETSNVSKTPSPISVVSVVARLRPTAPAAQAEAEIRSLRSHDPSDTPFLPSTQLRAIAYQERVVGNVRPPLLVLQAAAGMVLLIAIVNIANLLLARATTRQREIGIRIAVGAGRARVVRQLFVENFLLALFGGAAALALARAAILVAIGLASSIIPRLSETRLDSHVLVFTFAISLFAALAFGLAPAISLRMTQPNKVLKDGSHGASAGRASTLFRALLVGGELALAIILATGAGLMVKSFWQMNARADDFRPDRILTMRVSLRSAEFRTNQAKQMYFQKLRKRIAHAHGVEAAGFEAGAITMIGPGNPFQRTIGPVKFTSVSSDYPRATGMQLRQGRWLTEEEPNRVVLVNEAFAHALFSNRSAVGNNIPILREPMKSTIVGVTSNVKRFALDQEAVPEVFIPYTQFPVLLANAHVAILTGEETAGTADNLARQVSGIDRHATVFDVMSLEQALNDSIAPRRLNLFLLGSFAVVALLLAATGIYGVISYTVAQRTQEIGIRLALGARRDQVVGMVLRQGLITILTGVGIGSLAAVGFTRFMAGLLYQVKPDDPAVFIVVAVTLALTALVATWTPALRAARVDPAIALRYE